MTKKISVILIAVLFFSIVKGQENKTFLESPQIIKNPSTDKRYSKEGRKFSGIPSIAISPGGRMWSVWYAGITPGEDLNNYVVVSTSGDKGKTWQEVMVIDPDGSGKVRAYDPEIWVAPNGELWVFWAQAAAIEGGTWSLITEGTRAGVWSFNIKNPESAVSNYTPPTRITDGVMMCKPVVLTSGEWALPVSIWKKEPNNARIVVSEDEGDSWKVRGGASVPDSVRNFDEHMIIERKDGSLWMLIRTKYGIGESISSDHGFTWSVVTPSKISHPSARFFISRLESGNLLLVKHGPIDMRIGRSHLMAFISKDDGKSWSNGLLLDERPGVSYPDGQQVADGTIYIVYDHNRTKDQHILFASFKEEDVIEGTDNKIIEVFNGRTVISQGRKREQN